MGGNRAAVRWIGHLAPGGADQLPELVDIHRDEDASGARQSVLCTATQADAWWRRPEMAITDLANASANSSPGRPWTRAEPEAR
jgi:hypothetical protein